MVHFGKIHQVPIGAPQYKVFFANDLFHLVASGEGLSSLGASTGGAFFNASRAQADQPAHHVHCCSGAHSPS